MTFLLRIDGPDLSREVEVPASGSGVILGRDSSSDIPLPDPERWISRRHVAVKQLNTGLELQVISTVNHVDTSLGQIQPGCSIPMSPGDSFSLGPYRITVAATNETVMVRQSDGISHTPAFEGGQYSPSEFGLPPKSADEPARPGSGSSKAAMSDSYGTDEGFPPIGRGVPAVDSALEKWLGPSGGLSGQQGGQGPLDAFLRKVEPMRKRVLAPDHVHPVHLPIPLHPLIPTESDRPVADSPHTSAPPDGSVWQRLLHGSNPPVAAASGETDPGNLLAGNSLGESAPFQSIPPEPPAGQVKHLTNEAEGAWAAFSRELGLPEAQTSDPLAAARAGSMIRLLLDGFADLLAARADLKRELRAADRTELRGHDNNPLKLQLTPAELVQYLFGGQTGGGYMPADRAIRESVAELRVHEHATLAAARAAVKGALEDFDPARLEKRLHGRKPALLRVFDRAKLWTLYEESYAIQSQHMSDWLESVFSRHFMPAYSSESARLMPNSGADSRDST